MFKGLKPTIPTAPVLSFRIEFPTKFWDFLLKEGLKYCV